MVPYRRRRAAAFKRSLLFLLDLDPAIWGAGGEYRAVAAPRANYKNMNPYEKNVARVRIHR